MYDSDVAHFGVLSLGYEMPAKGNVLGAFPEAGLFGDCNCGFAVIVQDGGSVLVEAHFDAEFP